MLKGGGKKGAQQWRILIPGSPDLDKGIQETPRLGAVVCWFFFLAGARVLDMDALLRTQCGC